MVSFNYPPYIETAFGYMKQAVDSHKICGDGDFTKRCNRWMEERFGAQKVLLTTSGTTIKGDFEILKRLGLSNEGPNDFPPEELPA